MSNQEYERIVTAYADIVYRVALSYSNSKQDAEDVLQNTFLKLLVHEPSFRDEEHIRRWLIRVAVNQCNSLFGSYWKKHVSSIETCTEEPSFESADYSDLYHAVHELPAKYRIVIHLFYYEGYSTREIASLLHILDATVRSRLAQARKLLKQQLEVHST